MSNQSTMTTSDHNSTSASPSDNSSNIPGIRFVNYQDESQLSEVMDLVGRDLSEPYSIFTYRYFLYRFPQLCILAVPEGSDEPIGTEITKNKKIHWKDGDDYMTLTSTSFCFSPFFILS